MELHVRALGLFRLGGPPFDAHRCHVQNRAIAMVCAATAAVMSVVAGPVAGSGDSDLRAELDGKSIPLAQIAQLHCHDGSHPVIECFDSALERDVRLQVTINASGDGPIPDPPPPTSYVTWFDAINYGGSSFTASVSYADLGIFGWNDRISSFKSLNGGRPKWWRDTSFSGTAWRWPAGAWVANVGVDANDQWSSVANVP